MMLPVSEPKSTDAGILRDSHLPIYDESLAYLHRQHTLSAHSSSSWGCCRRRKNAANQASQAETLHKYTPLWGTFYARQRWLQWCYYILCFLTGGLVYLLRCWFPVQAFKLQARVVENPEDADTLLVQTLNAGQKLCSLRRGYVRRDDVSIATQWFSLESVGAVMYHSNPTLKRSCDAPRRKKNIARSLNCMRSDGCSSETQKPMQQYGSAEDWIHVFYFQFYCRQFVYLEKKVFADKWVSTNSGTRNPLQNSLVTAAFVLVQFNIATLPLRKIWCEHTRGITDPAVLMSRQQLFGPCEVLVPLPAWWHLGLSEVVRPFYIFQLVSVILWFNYDYYYYATAILLLSALSVFTSVRQTYRNNRRLHEVSRFSCSVHVLRVPPTADSPRSQVEGGMEGLNSDSDRETYLNQLLDKGPLVHAVNGSRKAGYYFSTVNSRDLCPGDIFLLSSGMKLPCDAILLTGVAQIDESIMTGESKPIFKTALPLTVDTLEKSFSWSQHRQHIVFGGTEVSDGGSGTPGAVDSALCLVVRTGFATAQGEMLRSLLFPTSTTRLNFERETWKFIGVQALLGVIVSCFSCYSAIAENKGFGPTLLDTLDIYTIAIPPALPIIVCVGVICALKALEKHSNCSCIMPSRINVAGRATVTVFDKTGTLTKDIETLIGVVPVVSENDTSFLPSSMGTCVTNPADLTRCLVQGLATCHSLSNVGGRLIGDPLEIQMLGFSKWNLCDPKHHSKTDLTQSTLTTADLCSTTGGASAIDDDSLEAATGTDAPSTTTTELDKHYEMYLSSPTSTFGVAVPPASGRSSTNPAGGAVVAEVGQESEEPRIIRSDTKVSDFRISDSPVSTESSDSGSLHHTVTVQDADMFSFPYVLMPLISRTVEPEKKLHPNADASILPNALEKNGPHSSLPPMAEHSGAAIIKVFAFDAVYQRMSVVAKDITSGTITAYCKGSLEKVARLCRPETIPDDLSITLARYTQEGLRVLALAQKQVALVNETEHAKQMGRDTTALKNVSLSATKKLISASFSPSPSGTCYWQQTLPLRLIRREDVESDMTFLGLLLFSNGVREDTPTALAKLRHAGCSLYMATGDNSDTAVAVGRQSGLLPPGIKGVIYGTLQKPIPETTETPDQGDPTPIKDQSKIDANDAKPNVLVWTYTPLLADIHTAPGNVGGATIRKNNMASPLSPNYSVTAASHCSLPLVTAWNDPHSNESRTSTSLLTLLDGRSLSSVCLAMNGETLRYLMTRPSWLKATYGDLCARDDTEALKPTVPEQPLDTTYSDLQEVFHVESYTLSGSTGQSCRPAAFTGEQRLPSETTGFRALFKKTQKKTMVLQEFVLRYFQIFSRMSPDDKALLIEQLQRLPNKPIVAMCGDGANDCAALRAADVGVSLSSREASVAAPFNSPTKSIGVLVDVLREGRGALIDSIQSFQFAALYALIQLSTVGLLNWLSCNLTDFQYIYMDLIVVLPVMYFMAWSRTSHTLQRTRPAETLVAVSIVGSILGQALIQGAFQFISIYGLLKVQGFYLPYVAPEDASNVDFRSAENTVLFLISNLQNVIIAATLSCGTRPWKKAWTNYTFLLAIAVFGIAGFVFILGNMQMLGFAYNWLSLVELPYDFRILLFLLVLADVVVTLFFQFIIVEKWLRQREFAFDFKNLNQEAQKKPGYIEDVVARCSEPPLPCPPPQLPLLNN